MDSGTVSGGEKTMKTPVSIDFLKEQFKVANDLILGRCIIIPAERFDSAWQNLENNGYEIHRLLERQELLGVHNEVGIGYKSLMNKKGWIRHPQVKRFIGKEHQLWDLHRITVNEMTRRGYNHNTPIEEPKGNGKFPFDFNLVLKDVIYYEFKRIKRRTEKENKPQGKKVRYFIIDNGRVIMKKEALLSEVKYTRT